MLYINMLHKGRKQRSKKKKEKEAKVETQNRNNTWDPQHQTPDAIGDAIYTSDRGRINKFILLLCFEKVEYLIRKIFRH